MLRFFDGFENYATLLEKWSSIFGGVFAISAGGRFGGNRIHQNYTGGTGYIQKDFDSQPTWIIGFGFKLNTVEARDLLQVADSGTVHMRVNVDAAGKLNVNRAGTVLGTGTTVVTSGVWHFVEVKFTIDDTAGVAVLRLNSVEEINLSAVDTRNGATASANQIRFMHHTGGGTDPVSQYDDIYICDATGSVNNDFLGDCRTVSVLPNANGNSSQLVGNDGNSTDNYLLVDEATPNSDTDYVESSTVGDKDTYNFASHGITVPGTVHGVQTFLHAKRTDAGPRSVCAVARLSSTEVDGANHALGPAYAGFTHVYETKPGGGAWALADIDNAEFGVKVTV
jgi:hypothetical protein